MKSCYRSGPDGDGLKPEIGDVVRGARTQGVESTVTDVSVLTNGRTHLTLSSTGRNRRTRRCLPKDYVLVHRRATEHRP